MIVDDNKDKGSIYEPLELDRSQITTNMNLSIRRSFNSVHNLDISNIKKDEGFPTVYKEESINLMGQKQSDTKVSTFGKASQQPLQAKRTSVVDILTREYRDKKEFSKTSSKKSLNTNASKKSIEKSASKILK
jgi:hypothetical protein